MSQELSDERAAFEAWCVAEGIYIDTSALTDVYRSPSARVAWRAWQARASAPCSWPATSHCQNGGDVCLAGNNDGVCCPEDLCDIDDGVRKAPVSSDDLDRLLIALGLEPRAYRRSDGHLLVGEILSALCKETEYPVKQIGVPNPSDKPMTVTVAPTFSEQKACTCKGVLGHARTCPMFNESMVLGRAGGNTIDSPYREAWDKGCDIIGALKTKNFLKPQAAEPTGLTDERAEFLTYWCSEKFPDHMRGEKWREIVDQSLKTSNANEKLLCAWNAWQARALLAKGE